MTEQTDWLKDVDNLDPTCPLHMNSVRAYLSVRTQLVESVMNIITTVSSYVKTFFIPLMVMTTSVPYFCISIMWRMFSKFIFPEQIWAKVDDSMYSIYQRFVLFLFEYVSGAELIFYGVDPCSVELRGSGNIIYLFNHQSSLDWVVGDMLAVRRGRLGSLRYILKDTLQYVPLYGFYFYLHGCVYVRRAGRFRPEISGQQLDFIKNFNVPTSFVLFPEGTRFSANNKHASEKSAQFAKEFGVAIPEYTLLPRVRGLYWILNHLRENLKFVHDVTILYERLDGIHQIPNMLTTVCNWRSTRIHIKLDCIPLYDVPRDEVPLRKWLFERFAAKENYLKQFNENGQAFPGEPSYFKPLPLRETLPSVLLVAFLTMPFMVTQVGRRLWLLVWLAGTLGSIAYMKLIPVA
ncbi:1-acyl-sn-glycerol-3-phosphate acyltransferase epsilon [Trichinella nativa]|uniref:1-acyl-sn-glycerol-3-phosphate acyltransferase epsilon n=1 Tax=Trichinella nativa TaxID=6335 RepID=A0A0V1LSA0_9BILA|nr:1-acyl-sn-glycerol-3-phosphate acyltransferase epsilon [Trichinella nativa]